MIFYPTKLLGAYVIEPEPQNDERGFFARSWDKEIFSARGLNAELKQCSISHSLRRGTLRGMHYQVAPYEEAKLVRCTRGAIYDVIVDLRPESATYKQWVATELNEENRHAIYCPEGFAHAFLTLTDSTEVFYQISQVHNVESSRGVRWNDPAFAVNWPFEPIVMAARDAQYPDFQS